MYVLNPYYVERGRSVSTQRRIQCSPVQSSRLSVSKFDSLKIFIWHSLKGCVAEHLYVSVIWSCRNSEYRYKHAFMAIMQVPSQYDGENRNISQQSFLWYIFSRWKHISFSLPRWVQICSNKWWMMNTSIDCTHAYFTRLLWVCKYLL